VIFVSRYFVLTYLQYWGGGVA